MNTKKLKSLEEKMKNFKTTSKGVESTQKISISRKEQAEKELDEATWDFIHSLPQDVQDAIERHVQRQVGLELYARASLLGK